MKLSGQLLTPHGLQAGTLTFDDVIQDLQPGPAPERFILPGFIDVHVHGGGGGDTMDGVDGLKTLARFHARHGTTSLLPTTITAPWPDVMNALHGIKQAKAHGVPGGADILGAHLEGPFISPQRLGAQPPHAIPPTPELIHEVLTLDIVRIVTLAPEIPGALDAAERFAQAGVRVSAGHSAGSHDDVQRLAQRVTQAHGTLGATHLFNAMGGLSGREPGVVGAILAHRDAFAELILDLHHVHPASFLAAYAALRSRLLLITDAMRATGTRDGESELGGQRVIVQHGQARLENGNLAGSVLTLDVALRNAVQCGLPLQEAARLLSTHPARYLGLFDRGELSVGRRADFVVLSGDLQVQEVWIQGAQVA